MSELTVEEKQRKGLRGLFRFLKRRDSEAALREAIEEFIEETETTDADQPPTGESSLLLNILKLGEKTAYDVMTPRVDIRAAPEDIDFRGLIQLVREHGHSRVPIYRADLDEIVGIVHIKDVLPYIFEPETFQLQKIMRAPMFVAPSIRVLDLLLQMRLSRAHIAMVVDEFGGIDGLVTIEDLVEEVIGEIEDEHDVVRGPSLVQRPDGTWLADARTTIEEFESRVGPVLTEDERAHDIDTLGGLVMSLTDRVPSRGELVTHSSGIAFEVIDADPRRIKRIRVRNAKPIAPERP
ncbi:MAG: HlyC/CorC family transporter [Rhodospirillales bacterium]|nr:HlyC/CorC family transporter [Rhodospirillales bacterium]